MALVARADGQWQSHEQEETRSIESHDQLQYMYTMYYL